MQNISVGDMIALQHYFASKKKPTAQDKAHAKKIDEILAHLVKTMRFGPQQDAARP